MTLLHLIQQELTERHQAARRSQHLKDKHVQHIKQLIQQYCEVGPQYYLSREVWQDLCFQQLFGRTCHTNIPFSTYLNQLMPTLGYPLGFAHKKLRVYRGLQCKIISK